VCTNRTRRNDRHRTKGAISEELATGLTQADKLKRSRFLVHYPQAERNLEHTGLYALKNKWLVPGSVERSGVVGGRKRELCARAVTAYLWYAKPVTKGAKHKPDSEKIQSP